MEGQPWRPATEEILYADLDLDLIERERKLRPYLTLRRSEVYAPPSSAAAIMVA